MKWPTIAAISLTAVAAVAYVNRDRLPEWAKPGLPGSAATSPSKAPGKGGAGGGVRAIAVEATKAVRSRTTSDVRAVGTLQSDEGVKLAPEISGRVLEISFSEGKPVQRGEVLIKLDDSLLRAELAQAKARLTLAANNNQRARALSRTGNVTERAGDEARSSFETATAEVELAEARLAKHVLKAPFDGVAGVRTVSVGAFVNAGTEIVNIEKIDRLKVDFKVPEVFLGNVKVGQTIEVLVDAVPGRTFSGEIYAINPLVDVNGRALAIRAVLANADMALRPGLFARILVKGITEREIVSVPEAALLPRGGETFVYRVDNNKAVETRVRIGERRAGTVEIAEGLPPDSMVVTAGQQKLSDGAPVEIVPAAGAARTELRPAIQPAAQPEGTSNPASTYRPSGKGSRG